MSKLLLDIDKIRDFNFLKDLSEKIELVGHKKTLKLNKFNIFKIPCHFYEEIINFENLDFSFPKNMDSGNFHKFFDKMLKDPSLISIFERSFIRIPYNTYRIRTINYFFIQSVNFLKKLNPEVFMLFASPHNIRTYILKWACFSLGIKVIYLQESILSWRYYLLCEDKNKRYLLKRGDRWNNTDSLLINDYKRNLQKKDYIAPYVLNNDQTLGKPFSFHTEIKNFWKRPDLILNKYKIFNFYSSISKEFKLDKNNYFFFPLQFSPERSTIPDGGKYFNQFRAITEIRSRLNSDIKIVIKEHPSMFIHTCHWGERDKNFYTNIEKLGNIYFAPINFPTIKLIKNSLLNISINNSIILESLILNCRASFMSSSRIFGHESNNLYQFSRLPDDFLKGIKNNYSNKTIFNEDWFTNFTFCNLENTPDISNYLKNFSEFKLRIYERLIKDFINLISRENINNFLVKFDEI